MPHRNHRHLTQQQLVSSASNSLFTVPPPNLRCQPPPPPPPPVTQTPPPLITDTLTACLDVNGTYVCTSYSPRCYIIQKLTPNSVTVTPANASVPPPAPPALPTFPPGQRPGGLQHRSGKHQHEGTSSSTGSGATRQGLGGGPVVTGGVAQHPFLAKQHGVSGVARHHNRYHRKSPQTFSPFEIPAAPSSKGKNSQPREHTMNISILITLRN
ncbi:heparan sulfate glucosamine 3-O-sulfotransferase 4-like [Folsomia candida]|uniref:heparan sulfate glucosamine 3-O-sulfotransferase 4-like n=1 Tax=Folsomia candida TaxID=158441 RepID=UPI0016051FE7|nr:heparan sulfate glucosamine 3-O-sulfotransferase 4-like [Folsomia candida]